MQSLRQVICKHNLARSFSSSSIEYAKSNFHYQVTFLKALVNRETTRKQQRVQKDFTTRYGKPSKILTQHVSRRMSVLNKLFMEHITDLMATGEVAPKLLGKGIEISHVRVTPDFQAVHVFWVATGLEDSDASIERILHETAKQLYHELVQLRVMGNVPPIKFFKNRQLACIAEVDEKLRTADFGEDFQPTSLKPAISVPVLTSKLPKEVREQILDLEEKISCEEDDDFADVVLPEMRNDILGVNHRYIMHKIKSTMGKCKSSAAPERASVLQKSSESSVMPDFLTAKEETEMFSNFLRERRIKEKQKYRRIKKEAARKELALLRNWADDREDDSAEIDFNDFVDENEHTNSKNLEM